MTKVTRRNVLHIGAALAVPPAIATLLSGCNQSDPKTPEPAEPSEDTPPAETPTQPKPPSATAEGEAMKIQYLEIVTPEMDALVDQYSKVYSITFSEPNAGFGGARTAELDGGGMIGIRGPMRESENPVVRPYVLVDDIKAAVEAAVAAGGEVAVPPMEIPEYGMFAIVINGGIDCGFWQN